MMVNNSTVHQYQQNKQSPFFLAELTVQHKQIMTYNVGNPDPGL
jgi:hypothetical protein